MLEASAPRAAARAVVVVGTSDRDVSCTTSFAPRSLSGFCTTATGEIGQRKNPWCGGDVAFVTAATQTPLFDQFAFSFDDLEKISRALDRREQRL